MEESGWEPQQAWSLLEWGVAGGQHACTLQSVRIRLAESRTVEQTVKSWVGSEVACRGPL